MVRFFQRQKRGRRGFVLLDVTAAAALLAAGIFTSVLFFRNEVREIRFTHERLAVMLLAESEIERLQALPYDEIQVGDGQPLTLSLPSAERIMELSGTLSVKEKDEGLKSAEVRLEWRVPKGTLNHFEMKRFFAREGGTP